MELLSFPPVAGSEDSDYIVAVSETNGENPAVDPAETVVAQLS